MCSPFRYAKREGLRNWREGPYVCCATPTEGVSTLRLASILFCLALAACGPYPRDVSGTLDAIERDGRLRVGFAAMTSEDRETARAFVARLERATGAQAEVDVAPMETLLGGLEDGELDLVIAEFRDDTPWATPVAIVEPLSTRRAGKRVLELAPAVRNGENRWVALIEREVRDGQAR